MQYPPRHSSDPSKSLASPAGERRWSLSTVAGAVALVTVLTTSNAWALALGRVSVQSLLGEPLRAEIDVPSISTDEAATLQVTIAPMERFRAASMEYNPLLSDVTFELVKRPDGRNVVRVRSNRVFNEPFLDLVVQATWANGQLLRGYTLLLDPPNLRPAPTPLLPAAPAAATQAPAAATARAPAAPAAAAVPGGRPAGAPPAAAESAPKRVTVARGDTAGRIAAAYRPNNATLEQMLIGLLRQNPQAFIGNNVNRLKTGVVLDVPSPDAVTAIDPSEARQLVATQSRDFNEYRRRLAAAAPAQDTQAPNRSAAGTVQTEVKDGQAAQTAPDRLTLSKGASGAAEAQIAQARQQQESSTRATELSRNLQELEQLRAATQPAGSPPASTGAADTAKPAQPALEATAPTPPAEPPAAAAPAPAPAPAPAAPPPPPAPAAAPTTSWVDELLATPYLAPAAGGLVALAGLLALLRIRQRRKAQEEPDEAQESRFADAEGQSVDTSEEGPVSSMMYSPSQLDAGGDVDPVAEADVYLAYGRDKQAEEILLEALRLHPDRLAVRAKLLEVYAQRADVPAYNAAAQELYDLTLGEGPEWAQARETGLTLDPDNALYRSGAPTPTSTALPTAAIAATPITPAADASTDIDLSFDLPDAAPPAAQPAAPAATDQSVDFDFDLTQPEEIPATRSDLDFDLDLTTTQPPPVAEEGATKVDDMVFDFDLGDTTKVEPEPQPRELPAEVQELSLDLDLDAATAELGTPQADAKPASEDTLDGLDDLSSLEVDDDGTADPLETKLSLAREFEAIGDTDGARSLAEEVEAEASGALKDRARAFLAQLS